MPMEKEQEVQERKYSFPYHYIPGVDGGNFSQTRNLPWGYEYLSYLSFVQAKVRELKFESLLDIGCGDGKFLYELDKELPGKKLTGVDFSKRAINHAKAFSPDIQYTAIDAAMKKAIIDEYDIITLVEVLEHIVPGEIYSFLDEVSACLKKSGILILTVPSNNRAVQAKHYQHFDLDALKSTLNSHFDVLEYYFLNDLSWRTRVIHSLLTNKLFILNSKTLLNLVYGYYMKNLSTGNNKNTKRICVICKKRKAE